MNRHMIRLFVAASTLRSFIASRMSLGLGGGGTPSRRMRQRLRLLGPFVALAVLGGVFTPTVSAEPGEPPVPDPPSTGLQAGFTWVLSRYHDQGGDGFPDPARTVEDVQAGDFPVALDGCHSAQGKSPIVAYVWNLNGAEVRRTDCRFTWRAPAKGTYPVSLTVETADGSTHSQTQLAVVRDDLLIASIGDSLGAGQGNPHSPAIWALSNPPTVVVPATWEDTRCHRSATAGSAQAAKRIEQRDPSTSVTFVHLACSGAQIVDRSWKDRDDRMGGLLDSYEGQDDAFKDEPRLQPQVYALRDLVKDREIDALMVSIGVNDLGFASIIERCIAMDNCQAHLSREVGEKLETLPAKYHELADRMHGAWWVPPAFPGLDRKKVFINEYPDFTHDDDGRFCSSLIAGTISTAETVWMASLGQRLNEKIRDAATRHGWTVVDKVADEYQRNGECADDHWFVRVEESKINQGNIYGAMHPNAKGHTPLRERFLSFVQPALLSPLPPRVTVNGLAPQGTHAVGTAPKVVVYDPLGLQSSPSVTLDGAAYTSESPITSPGPHTLVVDATNTAGLRSTLTIAFSLEAVEVSSLSVAPVSVVGGMDAVASVQLNRSAPAGGVTVTLSSSNSAAASLPETSVLIPEGESVAERAVKTLPVAPDTLVTISAATPGSTPKSASLMVQAPRVTSFALDESRVAGGTAATATVYLNGPAPAGGLSLTLATSNGTVVPSKTVSVPSGETTASSSVQTEVVAEPTAVTLSITGHPAPPVNMTVFPTRVVVPHVVGLSETAAVDLLRESGLTWKLTGDVGHANSKVHTQTPAGDMDVDFGTEVTLGMTTLHAT